MEIYDPFHLEAQYNGAFSIINTDIVKNIKLATGGFSAKYPDRLSGVMGINAVDKPNDYFLKFAFDLLTSLFLNKRMNRKINFFLSARRSNFDFLPVILQFNSDLPASLKEELTRKYGTSDESTPIFYDLWSKLDYRASLKHNLSFNFLFAMNDFFSVNGLAYFRPEYVNSLRKNFYGWVNWSWLIHKHHYSVTTIGYQNLSKEVEFALDLNLRDDNIDNSKTGIFTLKQKNIWEGFENHTLEYGFELHRFHSNYTFDDIRLNRIETTEDTTVLDSIFVNTELSGSTFSGYVQDAWSVSNKLDFLLGLRLSKQSYTNSLQIAPRTALKYRLTDNLDLKLAYGLYTQPDNFQKLKSYLGQNKLDSIPEKSIHYFADLTYARNNISVNIDAYFKDYISLNDDYSFDLYDRSEDGYFDVPFDTRKGTSKGFDVFIRGKYAKGNTFSVAYSYSKNRITNKAGVTAARNLDRTHSISINKIFKFKNQITLSALWRYHSGDPFTPNTIKVLGDSTRLESSIYFEAGEKNSARLPAYHSLDFKIEKAWQLKNVKLIAYLNVLNVYNTENIREKDYGFDFDGNGKLVSFFDDDEPFFRRIFIPGISIIF